jgi:ribonuclease HII
MAVSVQPGRGIYAYEAALRRGGFPLIGGADEAGRGACAGPLVAGAVILHAGARGEIDGLADSKLLSPKKREQVYDVITKKALAWAVVLVTPQECDQLGMHQANLTALRRALARLAPQPNFALTDGFGVDGLGLPSLGVWKGDKVAACVAAASVVAKVTRDRLMESWHEQYPEYGLDIHKGYCTALHQQRLEKYGASQIHRQCFANVRQAGKVRPK